LQVKVGIYYYILVVAKSDATGQTTPFVQFRVAIIASLLKIISCYPERICGLAKDLFLQVQRILMIVRLKRGRREYPIFYHYPGIKQGWMYH
jgi:hypothetical protein